jgi:hypothetical protein
MEISEEPVMAVALSIPSSAPGFVLRHAQGRDELTACFPVIAQLRPALRNAAEWVERATNMATDGYRVLAAWDGDQTSRKGHSRPASPLLSIGQGVDMLPSNPKSYRDFASRLRTEEG